MSLFENTPVQPAPEPGIIGEFPCTQTQLRCWVLDQLNPGNPALNVAVRWEIRGAFKASTIEAAFRRVIQRHEVLRTRIVDKDGQPVQQVVEQIDFKMAEIDLRKVSAEQRQERIMSIGEETARAPFDLGKPGLFRVCLLMVENDAGILLITAHQSCFDGWSIRVLGREVGEIASAIDMNRQPALPELPLQYGDYALWQQEYLTSYGFEAEKAFWRERLVGAPYFEVPSDQPRGAVKTTRGNILSISQPIEFSNRMDAAARRHRVSQYSYGAAIVSAMLHRSTAASTVLFGSQVAGREHSDLEDMIGVFINNLVLRFDVSSDRSFTDHIQEAAKTVEDALNHQRVPFNKLVEMINPVRDPSRNPLISVNFNLQKAFLEDHRYGGFDLVSAPSQSPGVVYDLSFMMVGRPTGWRMSIEYNADLFEPGTIETLLKLWPETYEIALSRPDALLSSLSVLTRNTLPAPAGTEPVSKAETILRGHPDIADAVIIERSAQHPAHAFVTPRAAFSKPLDGLPSTLMEYLSARVANDSMPGGVSVLLNLPRTETGAIDRRALQVPTVTSTAPQPAVRQQTGDMDDSRVFSEKTEILAAIWRDLLQVPAVRTSDDFFALGGHSLLALRMLSAVRDRLGLKPNLELLFKKPTLQGFAAAIFDAPNAAEPTGAVTTAPAKLWELVTCKAGSGDLSVYTLNHPFLYYRLANEMAENVSVHNVNMFNAELGGQAEDLSFQEIAKSAIETMHIDPKAGSVAIVGLCVNGVLAMEVTRQLREQDIDVAFTAIIDAWAPGFFRSLPDGEQAKWHRERRIKRVAYFTRKLLTGRMRLLTYLKEFNVTLALVQKLGISGATYSPEETANEAVTGMLVRASRKYRPAQVKDGSVILLRSQATHPRARKLLFGWGAAVAETTPVLDLDGWHEDSLTGDGIRELAAIMSKNIENS